MKRKQTVRRGRRRPAVGELLTKQGILKYLRELADRLGKDTLTTHDVEADAQISPATICRKFGGFSQLLIEAGLQTQRTYKRNRQTMLSELAKLLKELGRSPSKAEIGKNLSYNARHFTMEFGSVDAAIQLAKQTADAATKEPPMPRVTLTKTSTRRRYGPSIDFRGLRHAPINEQGVLFLFGMLAQELGFVVESIQQGFPDCDAKLTRPDGTYEGVRIEFEYKSSSFRQHGHDSKRCDIVVCWEHDWPDCPLEVVDLSERIRSANKNT